MQISLRTLTLAGFFLCLLHGKALRAETTTTIHRDSTTTRTYQRALSLAPNITQTIYAIGAQDRLIGVTDFDSYPPEVSSKPRAGGWSNPNFEVIRGLNPDVILLLGRHEKVRQFATERGIAIESFDVETVEQIRDCIRRLGDLLGATQRANDVLSQFDRELNELRDELADRFAKNPTLKRPTVFLCIGRQEGSLSGLTTVTGGSFLQQALEMAGGVNVFGDLNNYYPSISKEALLARKPEVIIELHEGAELSLEEAESARREWLALSSLPAVKNNRVYVLSAPGLLVPGTRFPQSVRQIQSVLFDSPDK